MSLCGIGVRTTSGLSTFAPLAEIIPGADRPLSIFEIAVIGASATGQTVYVGRPPAIGQNPVTPVLLQRDDPAEPACLGATALAWGVGPTAPSFYMRTISIVGVAGSGFILTFPGKIVIPVIETLVVWGAVGFIPLDVNIMADEL